MGQDKIPPSAAPVRATQDCNVTLAILIMPGSDKLPIVEPFHKPPSESPSPARDTLQYLVTCHTLS